MNNTMKTIQPKWLIFTIPILAILACKNNGNQVDAFGVFEATEIIVSAEAMGNVVDFSIEEGSEIKKDSVVGKIDPVNLNLQKEQVESSLEALKLKTNDAGPNISILKAQLTVQQNQINVIESQLKAAIKDQGRIQNLVNAQAAPSKQLDDINTHTDVLKNQLAAAKDQLAVLNRQIKAQQDLVSIQNRGILSEKLPLQKKIALVSDQIAKTRIINPENGTVLAKYIERGEFATPGKALYKLANLQNMTLKAYITGNQLGSVKLNQVVTVSIDQAKGEIKTYEGKITWISEKAEFTPKTIQTRDERANLVYPIKVLVKNDGYLKIGMYGDVSFQSKIK